MKKLLVGVVALAAALLPLAGFGGSPVADAAATRDFNAVKTLIAQKSDVNAAQADGSTALHWAVYHDNAEAVDLLLKNGADTKAVTRLNATPLYIAAESGNAVMLQKLLAAGADPNQTVLSQGETPLMFAARSGNVEAVKVLLDKGAQMEAVEKLRGSTALLWAAEQNQADVLKLLVTRGAKVDAKTSVAAPPAGRGGGGNAKGKAAAKGGDTKGGDAPAPIAAAAAKGKAAAPAADDDDPDAFARPPAGGNGGLTALILATREGALESMKVLLDAGAPINQQSANGNTALIVAAMNGNAATVNYLLERGADVNLANAQGWTPLYLTIKSRTMEKGTMPNPLVDKEGLYKAIEFMIAHGVDVNARIRGNTEVHNGIAATWLREAGATAFLRAAFCADLPVMKLLLANKADPNIQTTDKTTALMALSGVGYADGFTRDFGSEADSLEAMKILIDLGADVNAVNADGVTALHGAAHKNFLKGIEYLVSKGGDLAIRSHRETQYERKGGPGNTALDWATGIQIGMQSAIYHEEAVALISKLMVEHGLEAVGLSRTKGGNAKKQ